MSEDATTAQTESGWAESAAAYIAFQDRGDPNRTVLLDPVMLRLCGDVRGRDVLDDGCGEGRFSRMLAERGARVTGIDATPEMARTGARRGDQRYAIADAARLPFGDASFDIVVSYITLVDIVDYAAAIREMARVLRPGGRVAVANLGFVSASLGWQRDDEGKRLYERIDRYAEEWSRVFEWLGMRIVNWHRPLSAYMRAYLSAGLTLRAFEEPVPPDDSLRDNPLFEDWYRVPLFTAMLWTKDGRP
ncbi:MAG: class I SAM-dependent methyltransferase [Dehalococcoidia bacterium]